MAWMEWTQEYSVDIVKIDDQHKKLIGIINELYEALTIEGGKKEAINKVINELYDYTQYHFSAEEELMRKFSYPQYINHKSAHDNFIMKVVEFQDEYRQGRILVLNVEIIQFLRDWLFNHILTVDKQYSSFFNQQGIK